jgi:hypothetical protein
MTPSLLRAPRRIRAPLRSSVSGAGFGENAVNEITRRFGKWLVWTVTAAATAVAVLHGSARLLPLLSLRPITRSSAIASEGAARKDDSQQAKQINRVAGLWSATDDLRAAFSEAKPHDTVTLQTPGPFLLDAIEINKPITLRGADGVRPLFLGGPGSSLQVTASRCVLRTFTSFGSARH